MGVFACRQTRCRHSSGRAAFVANKTAARLLACCAPFFLWI